MKKYIYIIILIIMLFIDLLLFFVGDTIGGGFGDYAVILAAIFAEIAIYSTLIIFEVKKNE